MARAVNYRTRTQLEIILRARYNALIVSLDVPGGQKIKVNDRRSAGLVQYPRIGRNSELLSLPRSDRAQGMLHYPRVGRSDASGFGNLNRFHDLSPETDVEFYAVRDVDPEALVDLDYEDGARGKNGFFGSV